MKTQNQYRLLLTASAVALLAAGGARAQAQAPADESAVAEPFRQRCRREMRQ